MIMGFFKDFENQFKKVENSIESGNVKKFQFKNELLTLRG